jgi:hypothetical protein
LPKQVHLGEQLQAYDIRDSSKGEARFRKGMPSLLSMASVCPRKAPLETMVRIFCAEMLLNRQLASTKNPPYFYENDSVL